MLCRSVKRYLHHKGVAAGDMSSKANRTWKKKEGVQTDVELGSDATELFSLGRERCSGRKHAQYFQISEKASSKEIDGM